MIGERDELLARLLRYHGLVRGMADSRTRAALRAAIAGIERRLAELDRSATEPQPSPEPRRHAARAR
jgi:hypothetical protein